MDAKRIKKLIAALGFLPKEGAQGIYQKKYAQHQNYVIEINLEKEEIVYGDKIRCGSKRTQNFSCDENFVVLECVDRLLQKGYSPENIELEKVWSAGHGHSAELDICVYTQDGSQEFMLIECKTYAKEFDKAFSRMKVDGGQLFTYFKFSNSADWLVLYASELHQDNFVFKNEIVKIEDDYRKGDVKEFYDRWNKLTKDNGVFDDGVLPYRPTSRAIKIDDLKEISKEDSNFIFNQFLEILRHNVVSDKPNAFNKIFTLFLCKIYDEKEREGTSDALHFQWREDDSHVTFQLRLTDLYKNGMSDFLDKTVSDFSEAEFDRQYKSLDEKTRQAIKKQINSLRLEKNNEFAIKEVFDKKSFEENAVVVREVVELLQKFKIRYNRKHQYLSDFFELLLTTGLKQEAGQFFTPVPIAQFIVRSLPIDVFVREKMQTGEKNEFLPYIIDYAAGSGHFLTESMHLIQQLVDSVDLADFGKLKNDVLTKLKTWRDDPFDWALTYIYGVEKDYRLVKVGKVGCYLHGDGLANVIHSDGLASFGYEDYKEKLKRTDKSFPQDNKQFDVVVSNPPYSVAAFKNAARNYYTENDFELYNKLTDSSSEIECLFVERTKQLLKDGGVAGIILPSSMLSNAGIYTKTREIILKSFEIIAIAELGSNTFMATGTNTVVLFLRRRNNYDSLNLEHAVNRFFTDYRDVTMHGVEYPVSQYIQHVWSGLSLEDYISVLKKQPTKIAENHVLFQDYRRKFVGSTFWSDLIAVEREKLLYFILAVRQNVVLVKSGAKDTEKRFLGYEFSFRRGSEGIHPIQRGKLIDECTQMFDPDCLDNPEKASTYVRQAFIGIGEEFSVPENLKEHVFLTNLANLLVFDRTDFQKTLQLAITKKAVVKSKWNTFVLSSVVEIIGGGTPDTTVQEYWDGDIPWLSVVDFNSDERFVETTEKHITEEGLAHSSTKLLNASDLIISARGTVGALAQLKIPMAFNQSCYGLRGNSQLDNGFLYYIVKLEMEQLKRGSYGSIFKSITTRTFDEMRIPVPPKDIQTKIVAEIEKIEQNEKVAKEKMSVLSRQITSLFDDFPDGRVSDLCEISDEKENPQNSPDKQYTCLGLEHLGSQTGQIIYRNMALGRDIRSAKNVFRNGNVLYGKLRPYLNKVAAPNFDGICSTDILVLKTDCPKLLKHILLSGKVVAITSSLMRGTSLPRIGVSDFLNLRIPIPPLPEQKNLVAKIEELESEIEKLRKDLDIFAEQKNAVLKQYL